MSDDDDRTTDDLGMTEMDWYEQGKGEAECGIVGTPPTDPAMAEAYTRGRLAGTRPGCPGPTTGLHVPGLDDE